jgi:antitoxin component YwqK of YwqJK toxin-antitoxin module
LVFEGEYCAGQRHGIFNKYYADGKPYLLQTFVSDQLDGAKRKFDQDGKETVTYYEVGKLVQAAR